MTPYFKVYPIFLDPDRMEEVNSILGNTPFRECTWIDKDDLEEHPELEEYIMVTLFIEDLKNGKLDFIAFRLDY